VAGYSHLPLAYLRARASWSTPILSSQGAVLGTFAIYCREPRSPTAEHHKIIEQISHLASVAIEHKRTENALQESEERFRQMADSLPEVIWITSLDPEKMLYVSPSFERVWGLPVAEIYRNPRRWTGTIHAADRDRVVSVHALVRAGQSSRCGISHPSTNGAIRWIHAARRAHSQPSGESRTVWSGISTDITERRRSEDELRRSGEASAAC
jgi:PAS domain S-box-containing protein